MDAKTIELPPFVAELLERSKDDHASKMIVGSEVRAIIVELRNALKRSAELERDLADGSTALHNSRERADGLLVDKTEARNLLQMLSTSREFLLYIDPCSTFGKNVLAWLASNPSPSAQTTEPK